MNPINSNLQHDFHGSVRRGKFPRAQAVAEQAARLCVLSGDWKAAGSWHRRISHTLFLQGKYNEASAQAELAVETQPDPYERARALAHLAFMQIESFKCLDAFLTLGKAEEFSRSLPNNHYLQSLIYGFQALAFERSGDPDRAVLEYERAIKTVRRHEGAHPGRRAAHIFNNFGYFLTRNHQPAKGEEHILFALKLLEKHRQPHGEAIYLDSLGYAYTLMGRHDVAEAVLRKAARVFRAIPDKVQLLVTTLHLSDLHERMMQHERAHREATKALELATETGFQPLINRSRELLLNIKVPSSGTHKSPSGLHGLLYSSRQMQSIITSLRVVAATDEVVLLCGETGTGKELLAQAIHQESRRRDKPFVAFNCSTLTRELAESRLFGYRRGSFTGAMTDEIGVIRAAAGGTIFLDEIGDLSLESQGALLRFLQSNEVQPVGANRPIKVDVRIVAATNRDLKSEVTRGRFRKDLYYRLSVVTIQVPPLRERIEDVIMLSKQFAQQYARQYGLPEPTLGAEELKRITKYHWPGNVRELENYIKRRLLFGMSDCPLEPMEGVAAGQRSDWRDLSIEEKRCRIVEAVEANSGNITHAARQLGLSRRTIQRMLKKSETSE